MASASHCVCLDEVGGLLDVGQELFARHRAFGAVAIFLVAASSFRASRARRVRPQRKRRWRMREFDHFAASHGDVVVDRRQPTCRRPSSEPSIMTDEKPERMAAMQTRRRLTVVLVHDDRDVRIGFDARRGSGGAGKASPAYLRAPAEACMIAGASSSAAASMMAHDLLHIVDVEGGQAVAVFRGVVQQLTH
jgi:hypothetical protein